MVLLDIRGMLQSMGKDIIDFALPTIDDAFDPTEGEAREIIEESTIEFNESDTKLSSSLNFEQRAAYDEILASVECGDGVYSLLMVLEVRGRPSSTGRCSPR